VTDERLKTIIDAMCEDSASKCPDYIGLINSSDCPVEYREPNGFDCQMCWAVAIKSELDGGANA